MNITPMLNGGEAVINSAGYAVSSSYATTASYAENTSLHVEKGLISGSAFSGNPKNYTISFTYPFRNDIYIISVIGEDARIWTYNNKTAVGVTINSNSNQSIEGMMSYRIEER